MPHMWRVPDHIQEHGAGGGWVCAEPAVRAGHKHHDRFAEESPHLGLSRLLLPPLHERILPGLRGPAFSATASTPWHICFPTTCASPNDKGTWGLFGSPCATVELPQHPLLFVSCLCSQPLWSSCLCLELVLCPRPLPTWYCHVYWIHRTGSSYGV